MPLRPIRSKRDHEAALREDQEDLAAVRPRASEETLDYEEFLAKLEAEGAR